MTASFSPEQIQKLQEISRLPPEEQKKLLPDFLKTLSPEQVQYLQQQQTQGPKESGTKCPFCLIVQKQLQSVVLYEDEACMAVLDIRPATKGHAVVFPKEHVADFPTLSAVTTTRLFIVAQALAGALEEIESCEGVNVFVANGTLAGQMLDHVLVHVIPRYKEDGLSFGWEGKHANPEDLTKLAQQVIPKLDALQPKKAEQPASAAKSAPSLAELDEDPFAEF